jgi:hypothetical protein
MSISIGARMISVPISQWDQPEDVGTFMMGVPPGWNYREELEPLMTAFGHPSGLAALVSVLVEQDGEQWLHVSISRPDRMPTYTDLVMAKRDLVGRFRKAIQVFAPESEHVSVHNYCLHLWCCLTADPLPDFTRGNKII